MSILYRTNEVTYEAFSKIKLDDYKWIHFEVT